MNKPISFAVSMLESREHAYKILCKEIVATLILEINQTIVPLELRKLAAKWSKQLDEIPRDYDLEGYLRLAGVDVEGHPED
jgi:hypothetical protein